MFEIHKPFRSRAIRTPLLITAGFINVTAVIAQESDPPPTVRFGGFVDACYAYDLNRPASFDRAFTTQPARHNELNVNLAFIEAVVGGDRVRGRLALQAGTSVQSNYTAEPAIGAISGPSLARHIQEAVAGVRIADGLWVDAGIYFSHIGLEGFISRDNWTCTRSLMSDYSPYYQTGVRLSYQISQPLSAQLHILNGWQNISETNSDKAVGMQVAYAPSSDISIAYNNFIGNEAPDSAASRLRVFNNLVVKLMLTDRVQLALAGDVGIQRVPAGGSSTWYDGALIGRVRAGDRVAIVGRVEYYADPDQVIVATGTENGFQTFGASIGLDMTPAAGILWRLEGRTFASKDAIYPTRDGTAARNDSFVATSLAVTF